MADTLFDRLSRVYKNYIALTKEEAKMSGKEVDVTTPYDGESTDPAWGTDELPLNKCEWVIKQCPMLVKGVRKKSRDSTRTWFYLVNWNTDNKISSSDANIIREFERRSRFRYKFTKAVENAQSYGNGYIILSFTNDKSKDLSSAPSKKSLPWNARLVDSKKIKKLTYKNEYWASRKVKHFLHVDHNKSPSETWIHPDRIVHVPGYTYSNEELGNSVVNLLRNTIRSKVNVDIATGEILSWFAHGVFDVSVPGLQEDDPAMDKWKKVLKNHPGGFIHDTEEVVKSIEPEAINPKFFYDWIVLNIAAALVMPTHVLTGIQTGRVTGSEIGFGDYYKDIKDEQDLKYTPIIENLYKRILTAKGKKWKYSLVWNPIYIDEQAETEIMQGRAKAIKDLTDSDAISVEEKRAIYNQGLKYELKAGAYEGTSEDSGSKGTDTEE